MPGPVFGKNGGVSSRGVHNDLFHRKYGGPGHIKIIGGDSKDMLSPGEAFCRKRGREEVGRCGTFDSHYCCSKFRVFVIGTGFRDDYYLKLRSGGYIGSPGYGEGISCGYFIDGVDEDGGR